VIGNAVCIMQRATGEREEEYESAPPKNEAAEEPGRTGGTARAAKMDPERLAEIAKTAAQKRWSRAKAYLGISAF
jgi:hypothetical protein